MIRSIEPLSFAAKIVSHSQSHVTAILTRKLEWLLEIIEYEFRENAESVIKFKKIYLWD
jgi:hypothetical protein